MRELDASQQMTIAMMEFDEQRETNPDVTIAQFVMTQPETMRDELRLLLAFSVGVGEPDAAEQQAMLRPLSPAEYARFRLLIARCDSLQADT